MARNAIERVAAQVTVHKYSAYVGIRTLSRLNLGYGDKIAIVFPDSGAGGSDVRVKGYINSGNQISVPVDVTRSVTETEGLSERVGAYVEKLEGSWESAHDLDEQRWDNSDTLDTFEG